MRKISQCENLCFCNFIWKNFYQNDGATENKRKKSERFTKLFLLDYEKIFITNGERCCSNK